MFQGILTPALLHCYTTAGTNGPLGPLGPILRLPGFPHLVHMDREGPAVKLQHSLLENSRGREEEEGPDDGEGPLLEALGPWATEPTTAFILPRSQSLQTS